MKTTSIVIPAWCWDQKTLSMAVKCLENLGKTLVSDDTDLERIVVYSGIDDDGAFDEISEQIIRIEPRQGWATSVNMGMAVAAGEYICVGSIGVRVSPRWLAPLVKAAGDDAIASPLDYKADGVTRRKWDKTMRGSFWGAWYLFPRQILDAIGYLDGYKMRRMADMDWAIRARKAGFRTIRVDVKARHIAPHHVLNAHPDPYDVVMRAAFFERHGADRLGSWEGLPKAAS